MNRHQLEVAEMDRRQRLVVRSLSCLGAGTLAVAALWSAGLPPSEWWARLQAWLAPTTEVAADVTPSIGPQPSLSSTDASPVPSSASAATAGTESSLSTTPQPLFLIVTSPGRNKGEGTAQIGTNPDYPQTYTGGAVLANGARLTEIHRDHVILVRGNASARLDLYKKSGSVALVNNALLQVGGEKQAKIPVKETREVLTDYLRPSPVFSGETLRGYEVYAGPKAGIFSRLGLQPGDVIVAIDDAPLNDPQQAMELFAQLTNGNAVVVSIERKNARQRITLDGSLISADQEQATNGIVQGSSLQDLPQT